MKLSKDMFKKCPGADCPGCSSSMCMSSGGCVGPECSGCPGPNCMSDGGMAEEPPAMEPGGEDDHDLDDMACNELLDAIEKKDKAGILEAIRAIVLSVR